MENSKKFNPYLVNGQIIQVPVAGGLTIQSDGAGGTVLGMGGGGGASSGSSIIYNEKHLHEQLLKSYYGVAKYANAKWRETLTDEKLSISLELPGVVPNALGIQFSKGQIILIGQRFDTQEKFNIPYDFPKKYDPTTINAKLEYGILTITADIDKSFEMIKNIKVNK